MKRIKCSLLAILIAALLLLTACGNENQSTVIQQDDNYVGNEQPQDGDLTEPSRNDMPETPSPSPIPDNRTDPEPMPTDDYMDKLEQEAVEVIAEPEAITVLVNKTFALPQDYEPADLTEPVVPFIFKEHSAKRLMRKEAAEALETMFAAAKQEGIGLAGVSGYRSYATQKALFERYVERDGLEAASRYSARPGHSEHSTGLAMDVTGSDGKCAAQDCFGGTDAAIWLDAHAFEFGFIIRYPDGKEEITGYKYEPWHLRYVGVELATELAEKGITLEEYYADAQPVNEPVKEQQTQ